MKLRNFCAEDLKERRIDANIETDMMKIDHGTRLYLYHGRRAEISALYCLGIYLYTSLGVVTLGSQSEYLQYRPIERGPFL
jgi:hypothetical protein